MSLEELREEVHLLWRQIAALTDEIISLKHGPDYGNEET